MQSPLLTIICTIYNHKKYIHDTIEGFLNQKTTFPFEIILHDDASTDGTTEIVKQYASEFPHIIVPIIQEENQYKKGNNWGHPTTINPQIKGKYVALCEGDDYWTDNGKLEKQISYMESHPKCTMSFHAVNYVQNDKIIGNDRRSNKEKDFSVEEIIAGGGDFCATSSLCCRTSAYIQYPRFRKMAQIGDYPQQILMGLLGNVHYFPKIMGVYRYASTGSWTESLTQYGGDKIMYDLVINQIRWMSEFNCYTNYKYDSLVQEQIDGVAKVSSYVSNREAKNIDLIYQSASWRVGNFLIQPLHYLKVLLEKICVR